MRGQLVISELLQERQRVLARRSQVRDKRLHAVIAVSIDVALIPLVCQRQPFLSAQRTKGAPGRLVSPVSVRRSKIWMLRSLAARWAK